MSSTSLQDAIVTAVRTNADVVNPRSGGELEFAAEHAEQVVEDLRADGYVIVPVGDAQPNAWEITRTSDGSTRLVEDRSIADAAEESPSFTVTELYKHPRVTASEDAVSAAARALAGDRHEPTGPFDEPTVIGSDIDRAELVLATVQSAAPMIDLARLRDALSELDLHDAVDNDHDNGYRQALADVQDAINELVGER